MYIAIENIGSWFMLSMGQPWLQLKIEKCKHKERKSYRKALDKEWTSSDTNKLKKDKRDGLAK